MGAKDYLQYSGQSLGRQTYNNTRCLDSFVCGSQRDCDVGSIALSVAPAAGGLFETD